MTTTRAPYDGPRAGRRGAVLHTVGYVEAVTGLFILVVEIFSSATVEWVRVTLGAVLMLSGHMLLAAHLIRQRQDVPSGDGLGLWPRER